MATWVRLFGLLVWVTSLCILGIFMFTQGFLLKRLVVPKNSSCISDFHYKTPGSTAGDCWLDRSYKRAVIVIIDALRYDFIASNTSRTDAKIFHNKFKFVNELLRSKPMNTRLMKFMADPPTTTMQRLKGLTTGGLPTFIDAGENFASSEINEDNVIDQMIKNKKITFMGDDTWLSLYPNRFQRTFPFPSFNVMDLHTVDNGVIQHLTPEFLRRDWDVLIAHFLGVDHCGHRYGPTHPEMGKKLKQMDDVIRNLTRYMKPDTILFVMGDHGMTMSGDHGGDSIDELESALLVYSPSPITSNPVPKKTSVVSQIDLVPTLSLLLGLPIPYSNIGSVITDLFSHSPQRKKAHNKVQNVYYTVEALHLNAHQVLQYLRDYSKLSRDLPPDDVTRLESQFTAIETRIQALAHKLYYNDQDSSIVPGLQKVRDDMKLLLQEAKSMCAQVWTRFNLFSMVLGISAMEVAIFVMIELVTRPSSTRNVSVLATLVLVFMAVLYWIQDSEVMKILLGTGLAVIAMVICVSKAMGASAEQRVYMTFSKFELFGLICLVLQLGCLFSNSLVVHEDCALTFLISSLVLAHLTKCQFSKTSTKKNKFDVISQVTSPCGVMIIMTLIICICVRVTYWFHSCREEQFCESSTFLKPLGTLTAGDNSRNFRFILATMTTLAVPIVYKQITQKDGNLNGHSAVVICQSYFPKISAGCTILYWAQTTLPADVLSALPVWNKRLLPLTAYFTLLLSLLISFINPISAYIQYRDSPSVSTSGGSSDVIAQLFRHLKHSYNQNKPPLVYGLRTAYSAFWMFVVLCLVQVLTLLHSDGMSPVFLMMVVTMVMTLEIVTYTRDGNVLEPPPLSALILWMMLASKFFYATGHQAAIATIQWQSAFVGSEDDHGTIVLPAILVLLNTFGSHILFTMALPLLVIWPYARGQLAHYFTPSEVSSKDERGEYMLHENRQKFIHITRHTLFVYFCLSALKLVCTMMCAALLRRHLMVWKIFAPRFIFEGISFLVTSSCLCLCGLLMARLDNKLETWTKNLIKQNKMS